jgi:hypothetical protein
VEEEEEEVEEPLLLKAGAMAVNNCNKKKV